MEFLKTILYIMEMPMETPSLYGWFHIVWLGITVIATVILCILHEKDNGERVRKIILATSLIAIALEVYKQIVFSFSITETGIAFEYMWYVFPFQFCSTPMYIGLLAGLTKKGRLHDALCSYLATYSIFAGACVMLYPGIVFSSKAGLNVQTMICHGSMIAIGIYLLYTKYVKLEHKTILKATAVFASCFALAVILNEVMYYGVGVPANDSFNMFYVSPHYPGVLPVYSLIQEIVPFPICLILYLWAFITAAYLILLAAMGINAIFKRLPKISSAMLKAANAMRAPLSLVFEFKKFKVIKICTAVFAVAFALFTIINVVPPMKNVEVNPFIVEKGKVPMIAAHRGGGDCNPENTLLAFRHSVNEYNVDVIESDLYLTKDGYLVYNHDSYIDMTCNVNGDIELEEVEELCENEENRHYIKDMTLEELKQYNFGYYFEDENGERIYKDVEDHISLGLQIATVEMLFEEFYNTHPDLLFIIEIKNSGELGFEACRVLNESLEKYSQYRGRVVVGTFHDEIEKELRDKYPDLLRGAPTGSAASFILTQYLGVNIFDNGDFACLQIPMEYDLGITLPLDVDTLVDRAHKRNIAVQYWTVNDPDEMRRLIELGVDCIMTDNPELLAQVIADYLAEMEETDTNTDVGTENETESDTETALETLAPAKAFETETEYVYEAEVE